MFTLSISDLSVLQVYSLVVTIILLIVLSAYVDSLRLYLRYKRLYLREPRICRQERMGWAFRFLYFLFTPKSAR